jgi:hypothetical protein
LVDQRPTQALTLFWKTVDSNSSDSEKKVMYEETQTGPYPAVLIMYGTDSQSGQRN